MLDVGGNAPSDVTSNIFDHFTEDIISNNATGNCNQTSENVSQILENSSVIVGTSQLDSNGTTSAVDSQIDRVVPERRNSLGNSSYCERTTPIIAVGPSVRRSSLDINFDSSLCKSNLVK